jgi:hypothetical protein
MTGGWVESEYICVQDFTVRLPTDESLEINDANVSRDSRDLKYERKKYMCHEPPASQLHSTGSNPKTCVVNNIQILLLHIDSMYHITLELWKFLWLSS